MFICNTFYVKQSPIGYANIGTEVLDMNTCLYELLLMEKQILIILNLIVRIKQRDSLNHSSEKIIVLLYAISFLHFEFCTKELVVWIFILAFFDLVHDARVYHMYIHKSSTNLVCIYFQLMTFFSITCISSECYFSLTYSRLSISRTQISRILRNSKRLFVSKIRFDFFLQP